MDELKKWQKITIAMLGVEAICDIPLALYRRLEAVAALMEKVDGDLRSRQVIAMIVEQFSQEIRVRQKAHGKTART